VSAPPLTEESKERPTAVSVVLDYPRRHLGRRLWRRVSGFAGAVLVVIGLTASIAAVPSSVAVLGFVVGWVAGDESDAEPWPPDDLPMREIWLAWGISTPLAIAGIKGGLGLLRRDRALVLFLRRFGYDDAQSAVTFAVLKTIGASWRIVTLDDAEMIPIGIPEGTRRLFRAGHLTTKHVLAAAQFLGMRLFPILTGAMWAVVAIALLDPAISLATTGTAEWDQWAAVIEPYLNIFVSVMEWRLPLNAVGPDLPGLFALLAIAAALSFVVLIATGAALILALPFSTVLFFLSSTADAVREAERSKTAVVQTVPQIREAASAIARRSRKVFGPRLVVLRVASPVWQEAVTELSTVSALPLIDVSEPTENVLWELEELTKRFGPRCVLIGQHERVLALAAQSREGNRPGSIEQRIGRFLDGREVLAYTTDPRGLRRFARALRGRLLSRHSD
jgi:hypothetical protein